MGEAGAIARHSLAVTRRQYLVWRKVLWSSLTTNVANPILFLFAFGFGLGAVVDRMGGISYLAFVVPGMMAYSAMFAASFETTIGSFARFDFQKTWDATLATPVTLLELLLGEALWATCKAMISALCVLVVGALWGGVGSAGGALLSQDPLIRSEAVAAYGFSVLCAAVILGFTKAVAAAWYCAAAPVVALLYFFVHGFHPHLSAIDHAALIICGLLLLRYSLRVAAIARAYPDLPEASRDG